MKRALIFFLPLAVLAAGCTGDELDIYTVEPSVTDPSSDASDDSSSETGPALAWPVSVYSVRISSDSATFPELENPHGLSVRYSSSDPEVATIASDGTVTLVAAGSTTIAASFDGDDSLGAISVSYLLRVITGEDDGAGTILS